VYQQKETAVNNWLQQARVVLDDQADDPETCIRKHKSFFGKLDQKLINEYSKAGQDIIAVLEKSDQREIQESMADVDVRWKVLVF
jgi:Mg2+/Co2+ transporter CorC